MALFVLSDLHLSFDSEKPMDIFGAKWERHYKKIEKHWKETVTQNDTIVIPGDISWAMDLNGAKPDFEFINTLPGKKLILKGNHDYWWTSMAKMRRFFDENSFDSIDIIHNNSFIYKNFRLCGTRGWVDEENISPEDLLIINREAGRLNASLSFGTPQQLALESIVFLHYPPFFGSFSSDAIINVLKAHNVKRVYYGHIHGPYAKYVFQGLRDGTAYTLAACDYLDFRPKLIEP